MRRAKGGYLGHSAGRKNYEKNAGNLLKICIFPTGKLSIIRNLNY
jgi:hypothetical protein